MVDLYQMEIMKSEPIDAASLFKLNMIITLDKWKYEANIGLMKVWS